LEIDVTALQGQIEFPHDYSGCNDSLFEWPDQENFWRQLERHNGSIGQIYVNGGEPTLNSRHMRYLEELMRTGNAERTELLYNINLTYIPDELIQLWTKFKKVSVDASIDDTEERNEYIRFPSRWEKIEANFKRLLQYNVTVRVVQTISCFNLFTLSELSQWLHKISPDIQISYNFVSAPEYFSPLIIPPSARKKSIKSMYAVLPIHNHYNLFGKYYSNEYLEDEKEKFFKVVGAIDNLRKTNFAETFPALYEALTHQASPLR
jgi:sulfatase maturation enzyme AslB (radical SAM superfamily)